MDYSPWLLLCGPVTWRTGCPVSGDYSGRVTRNYIPVVYVSPDVTPDATSWNELDGVCSVDQTGAPMGWRSVERSDQVWQLRSGDEELLVSRGAVAEEYADWWVSVRRDGERVVDDHRVRVGADSELGEALAAVVTAVNQR